MGERYTMSTIIVRYADRKDLKFTSIDEQANRETIAKKIDLKHVIVAEYDNHKAGYLRLDHFWSKPSDPYISMIWVLEGYRKRGLGKAMLSFLAEELKGQGIKYLYSSSQADEPEPQQWHRHVGFQECGYISEINEGIDEIFFRKVL